ncbi:MAG TPA: lipocalin-like domain-containing protein [Burkholderiales bacterium]|nr:lipocalin-like domain-containing protein [Burkholderiales bacterium]
MARRRALALLSIAVAAPASFARAASSRDTRYAPVVPGYRIRFPDDEGSHPQFRTEWWYVTGWLERPGGAAMGFQVTFFRVRPEIDESNPSAFAAKQIVIAHAALSDAARGRLVHDQRVARAAFGLAGAETGRTRVWLDDWSLVQDGGDYRTHASARDFTLDLVFTPTQPPLLQGDAGFSRKGARPESASYYYSLPHLEAVGEIRQGASRIAAAGSAWLDHEWSSSYMDEQASGWDWMGINLDGGGALMAFRMRDKTGGKLWAGATLRTADGKRTTYRPAEVEFTPLRTWRSPRTGASYAIAWRVRVGSLELTLEPLMDDQESDSRASTGAVYWEGAVTAMREGKSMGRGYLELTGYYRPMKV